jgi:hypothetical protein
MSTSCQEKYQTCNTIILKKILHKMGYHVRTFMSFKPNGECHGHIYGIIHDNVPILGTYVYLAMPNNVTK